jgi:hypothetical protein
MIWREDFDIVILCLMVVVVAVAVVVGFKCVVVM